MAKNVKINGVTYQNVPEVDIPLATGSGTAKFHDTTGATAEAADVLSGETAFGASGAITGSMPNNGGTGGTITTKGGSVTIPAGYTTGGTVTLGGVADLTPQNLLSGKTVLGVAGALTLPTISQDATTKVLSIS